MAKRFKQHLYVGEIIRMPDYTTGLYGDYKVIEIIFSKEKDRKHRTLFGPVPDHYRYKLERLSDGHKANVLGFKDGLYGNKVITIIKMVEERLWE